MDSKLLLSRVFLIVIAILLMVLAIRKRAQVKDTVNKFFTESTHPLNLAVFRIVIFITLIQLINVPKIVWFSQMPEQLLSLPGNLGWLFNYLPINANVALVTSVLMLVFCFTGAIGLFSRTSALLATILGFYVLGLPQLWGKVSHYNHLLWFLAILAVSRCGDFLSVDAIVSAWKRADRSTVNPPSSSKIYALPLRFVWLLMGVMYFFPGFWKLWRSGYQWAWSDNLIFHMYKKWFELDGWTPIFRIDHYPLLNKTSGLWTIVWEISFIFLILLPKWRFFAVFMGLFFHNMTQLFMRISFWRLQVCYVAFFDWYGILHRLGRWLFPQPMYVVYDGNCKICRRTIASVRVFDIFGRITYVNALEHKTLQNLDLVWLESDALLKDMHTVVGKKYWRGFSAYRVLSRRLPILWLILPLMYLWPIPRIGDRIYRKVADSRTYSISKTLLKEQTAVSFKFTRRINLQIVTAVGILLLFFSIFYGIEMETKAWPFSCYPTFSWIQGPQQETLEVVPLNPSAEVIPFSKKRARKYISTARFDSLIRELINNNNPSQKNSRLKAFWQLVARNDPPLQQATSVNFYRVKIWLSPERQQENPISRELFYQLKL